MRRRGARVARCVHTPPPHRAFPRPLQVVKHDEWKFVVIAQQRGSSGAARVIMTEAEGSFQSATLIASLMGALKLREEAVSSVVFGGGDPHSLESTRPNTIAHATDISPPASARPRRRIHREHPQRRGATRWPTLAPPLPHSAATAASRASLRR